MVLWGLAPSTQHKVCKVCPCCSRGQISFLCNGRGIFLKGSFKVILTRPAPRGHEGSQPWPRVCGFNTVSGAPCCCTRQRPRAPAFYGA